MRVLTKIGRTLYNAFVKLLENVLSKKFLVFIVATVLLALGMLPPEHWAAIALAVLGVVSAIDFKHGTKALDEPRPSQTDGPPPTDIP
jgi:hypothetical protein